MSLPTDVPPSLLTDREIILRLNQEHQQPSTFQALDQRYRKLLLQRARCHGLDEPTAMDCVQETFLAVWTQRSTLAATNINDLQPWLFKVLNSRCCDVYRFRKRKKEVPFEGHDSSPKLASNDPAVLAEQTEGETRLLRLIGLLLTSEEAEALFGQVADKLSYAELAAQFGVSKDTIRMRLYHGRQKLEGALNIEEMARERIG